LPSTSPQTVEKLYRKELLSLKHVWYYNAVGKQTKIRELGQKVRRSVITAS
jgi:hypothetical protein